jgi:hypothetical protein
MGKKKSHHSNGMFHGLRRAIKTGAGAVVGVTGLAIAISPLLNTVQATLGPNPQTSSYQNLPGAIATTYGVSPSGLDLGRMLTTIAVPVLGGILFIIGLRAIVKRV